MGLEASMMRFITMITANIAHVLVVDRELDVAIVGSRSCYVYERHIARK